MLFLPTCAGMRRWRKRFKTETDTVNPIFCTRFNHCKRSVTAAAGPLAPRYPTRNRQGPGHARFVDHFGMAFNPAYPHANFYYLPLDSNLSVVLQARMVCRTNERAPI